MIVFYFTYEEPEENLIPKILAAEIGESLSNNPVRSLRAYLKDGKIVAHEGLSSRMPGSSSIWPLKNREYTEAEMRTEMVKFAFRPISRPPMSSP